MYVLFAEKSKFVLLLSNRNIQVLSRAMQIFAEKDQLSTSLPVSMPRKSIKHNNI
jgi:hypothetical protein